MDEDLYTKRKLEDIRSRRKAKDNRNTILRITWYLISTDDVLGFGDRAKEVVVALNSKVILLSAIARR